MDAFARETRRLGNTRNNCRCAIRGVKLVYNQFLSARLLNAETNLFNAVNQLAKSKRRDVSDMSVVGTNQWR